MFELIRSPKNLTDLRAISLGSDIYSKAKVLIVDNADVPQVEDLKNRNFNIKKFDDIQDIGSYPLKVRNVA